jgi:alkane 1-monooxygenase
MIHYFLIQIALTFAIAIVFGVSGLIFFAAQSAVAIILLEGVNYVEHYGLTRTAGPSGRYEPVNEYHSWDTNSIMTNYEVLPFHAQKKTRLLPVGYSAMILLAHFPPLWKRVMNPLVLGSQSTERI